MGTSKALTTALRDLIIAAHYGRAPVLILGETGTGKELAAKVAHAVSRQRGGLVVVDCTTIVPTLLGSELFGHERGAFTGAVSVRTGACSAADQGSLFLDEIGELPLDLQPELLRVIQEGAYKRVGGDRWLHSSFRLICATNRDLAGDVAGGGFRADLYHRIAATTVTMPPLRDRLEDVLGLFAGFCREASGASEAPDVDPSVQEALLHRDYPGNLRDLRQLASRVVARHVGPGAISPGDLPVQDRPVASPGGPAASPSEEPVLGDTFLTAAHCAVDQGWTLNNIEEEAKEAALQVALARCEGDKNAAARMLGVNVRTVQQRVKKKNDAGIPAQVSEESSSATSRQ
ncbi:sigma 54-interacting transcriptional regulator [Arthrobacter sp. L77]|uniref:sigma 54-interacting transcriptional regulator n=1 Tax=Arthrobacter sp. L77 TaxID=1496689 RepID=UPI0018CC874E|nr:sigma 54-interacting transcriptional regulator [Arthrobacter sp. L77]